ncbi:MAG: hypothetical protein ACI8Q6_003913 [Granulosicoccus sp.]|jgi:hypothetical protein
MNNVTKLQRVQLPELTPEQERECFAGAWVMDRLMAFLPYTDFKVLRMIFADTYVMGRQDAPISLNDFTDGYHDARGFHGGTGLTKPTVRASIKSLMEAEYVSRTKDGPFREPHRYRVNFEPLIRDLYSRANPVRRRTRK